MARSRGGSVAGRRHDRRAPQSRPFLLRASLRAAGVRNDIDEDVIHAVFAEWRIDLMQRTTIPSDTRSLDVLLVRLTTS